MKNVIYLKRRKIYKIGNERRIKKIKGEKMKK